MLNWLGYVALLVIVLMLFHILKPKPPAQPTVTVKTGDAQANPDVHGDVQLYKNPQLARGISYPLRGTVEFRTNSTNSDNYVYRSLSGPVGRILVVLRDGEPVASLEIPSMGVINDLKEVMDEKQLYAPGDYSLA
jgi:hypothetical protein